MFMYWNKDGKVTSTAISLLVVGIVITQTCAQESHATNELARIATLIDSLASTNRSPWWDDPRDIRRSPHYPPDYDFRADDRVFAARDSLLLCNIEAIPQLIDHWDDKRYSHVYQHDFYGIRDVGSVCQGIVRYLIEVHTMAYASGNLPRGEPRVPAVRLSPNKDNMKKWWEQQKGKSLLQLQLDSAQWAIEQETARGGDDQKTKAIIERLERIIKRLKSTKEPIRVDWQKNTFRGADTSLLE